MNYERFDWLIWKKSFFNVPCGWFSGWAALNIIKTNDFEIIYSPNVIWALSNEPLRTAVKLENWGVRASKRVFGNCLKLFERMNTQKFHHSRDYGGYGSDENDGVGDGEKTNIFPIFKIAGIKSVALKWIHPAVKYHPNEFKKEILWNRWPNTKIWTRIKPNPLISTYFEVSFISVSVLFSNSSQMKMCKYLS